MMAHCAAGPCSSLSGPLDQRCSAPPLRACLRAAVKEGPVIPSLSRHLKRALRQGRGETTSGHAVATEAENSTESILFPSPAGGKLLANSTVFVEEHRIRAPEAGPNQLASMLTMANLMQEVAGNHGVAIWGRGDKYFGADPLMIAKSLIFAVTRMQIQMDKYPKWGDVVQLETWFQADGRIAARREWIMRDAATGERLGRATSTWILLNMETHKVSKIPEEMQTKLKRYAPDPPRSTFQTGEHKLKLPELERPAQITAPTQVARRADMDMNGHINNVTYLGWALETVPQDIYENCHLQQVEMDFKDECYPGATVDSLGSAVREDTNGSGVKRFIHVLERCEGERCWELVRCRTTWTPNLRS